MFSCRVRRQWVSVAVVTSLLVQLLLPALQPLPTARAAPETPHRDETAAVLLGKQIRQLTHILVQLEQATDPAAFHLAMEAVAQAWPALWRTVQQVQQEFVLTEQRTGVADFANLLKTHYEHLIKTAQTDHPAAQQAAAALRTVLHDSIADPAEALRPSFDVLPDRPVPEPAPAARLPAVSHTLFNVSQSQRQRLAAPAQTTPATEADLLSTVDAEITPEIQELADSLDHDVKAIYEYVRNKIAVEPYYGSRKGALLTLWERSGNDMDTASLLIALLRASDHPARYVQGTIAVDAKQARNWVGNAPDLDTAAKILSKGGVPVSISDDRHLVKEHVWVQVKVPAAGPPAQDWIGLDASFKQFNYRSPADLKAVTGFDAEQWVNDVRSTTLVNDRLRSIASVPTLPSSDFPDDENRDRNFVDVNVQQAVADTHAYIRRNPDLTTADFLGGAYIIPQAVDTLPEELPYQGGAR